MSVVYLNMIVLICCYFVTVLVALVSAAKDDQEPVSINKSIMRPPKPWHFSTDYVRCFCNLPSCVTTGYMCKSSAGGCFSDVLDHTASVYRGRHGCLEILTEKEQRTKCQTRGGMNERTIIRKKENSKSLFLCCHHDMCNHIESPQTKSLMNNSLLGDIDNEEENRIQQEQEEYLYSNSDVWFRAATIAVPICGAVILFALIALAVKILKSEHQNTTMQKLGPTMYVHHMPQQCKMTKDRFDTYDHLLRKEYVPTHHHNNFFSNQCEDVQRQAQVPLLMPNEITKGTGVEKNETNAVLNYRNVEAVSGKSIILEIEKETPKCLEVNIVNSANESKFTAEKTFLS